VTKLLLKFLLLVTIAYSVSKTRTASTTEIVRRVENSIITNQKVVADVVSEKPPEIYMHISLRPNKQNVRVSGSR
jgi:phosphopantothenoylcysteine synthetase/decarboxylase